MDPTQAAEVIPYVSPAMVVAGVGTALSWLAALVMALGKQNFNLRLEAISKIAADNQLHLNNEKSDRERDVRELRAKLEETQKSLQAEREEKIELKGRILNLQSSLDQRSDSQDRVLEHQNKLLDKIDRKVTDVEVRKESKGSMTAVRPIPRVEPRSDPPPMRPRLPSVRRGDGE